MKLPSSVKVGYRPYRIQSCDRDDADNHGSLGLSNHDQGLIKSQIHGSRVECANTLLHEILHCCMSVGEAGLEYEAEERAVTVTANMLIGICQTNPEVIRWVMRNARADD